jgi:hypothetical protein
MTMIGLVLLHAPLLFAETLRCGASLIQPGMTTGYVLDKCGAPTSRETFEKPLIARRANGTTYEAGTVTYEVWRYDRGPRQFPARLTFSEGVLKTLEFEK